MTGRPRDAAGRPLPPGSVGVEQLPDDLALSPAEALVLAQQLLDADRPFYAHEVLEMVWKATRGPERDLWRGLAQLAVGLTHAQRGNPVGAARLLRRGAGLLSAYDGTPHGVDVAGLGTRATELAGEVERSGGVAARTLLLAQAADERS